MRQGWPPLPEAGGSGRPGSAALHGYADLARRHRRGIDYEVIVQRRAASSVAVVAPHGGGIERATSAIARALAGDDHNLYLFEGRLAERNFETLHLTSHRFDEPDCLALVAQCEHVLTVHGCNARGELAEPDPGVLLGGLDVALKARLAAALGAAGVPVLTGAHRFPARHPDNICNRGRRRVGVQLELTGRLRGGPLEPAFVAAVRAVLQPLSRMAEVAR
jgi:phage replication-related protein YjqB (UPF0714/DUF867 family)